LKKPGFDRLNILQADWTACWPRCQYRRRWPITNRPQAASLPYWAPPC